MDINDPDTILKLGKLLSHLESLAKKNCWHDRLDEDSDAIVDDFAGGNVDDAYWGGLDAGEILMAREVLTTLGIDWQS